ncbi:MAG: hypothetical protein OT477_23170 [Chloroflexi bacterium]|nr:hypothetical protein [Chloroflexota bacterium]
MFDWQTEDDGRAWQDQATATPPPPPRGRYFLLLPILVILVLVGGATYAYTQVRQRMDSNIRAAQTAVLTSHELIIQATTTTDTELFTNLLSGRDSRWTNGQVALFRERLLFNRPQLGLATAEIRGGDATITLSADLEEAVVARPVRYTVLATGETIHLEQIALFRQGSERWLMAPLDSLTEWSAEETFRGQYLAATYPEADTAAALAILQPLDEAIGQACQLFDSNCPADMRLNLRFTTEPRTLAQMLPEGQPAPTEPLSISESYILPTPALLGRALDEAGAQILYQGYAQLILGDVLRRGLVEYWDNNNPLYDLAVSARLAQLGATPQPTAVPLPPADIPYEQDIAALCMAEDGLNLVQYRPPLATQTQLRGRFFAEMIPAPDGRAIALRELLRDNSDFSLWLPNSQTALPLLTASNSQTTTLSWRPHPEWPKLLATISLDSGPRNRRFDTITFTPPCDTTTCAFTTTRQTPNAFWSPNGQQTLIRPNDGRLLLGDGNGVNHTWVGVGQQPLWLDDSRYLYLSLADYWQSGPAILYTADTSSPDQNILLTSNDLLAALPEAERPLNISFLAFEPFGANPTKLFILGGAEQNGRFSSFSLFQYNLATAELQLMLTAPQIVAAEVSPTAEQVAAVVVDPATHQLAVHLYDIATSHIEIIPLPSPNNFLGLEWSAEGEWLLATAAGQPYLIHPATAALYRTPLAGCSQAAWVAAGE